MDPATLFPDEKFFWVASPASSLEESIARATSVLRTCFPAKIGNRREVSFDSFFLNVQDWMQWRNCPAHALEFRENPFRRGKRSTEQAYPIAVAFLIEAINLHGSDQREKAWWALTKSCYYLGMATGPSSASDSGGDGGKERLKAYNPSHAKVVSLLNALEEKSYSSITEMADAIQKKYDIFRKNKEIQNSRKEDPDYHHSSGKSAAAGYINNLPLWLRKKYQKKATEDEDLLQAIDRLRKGSKRGRKPKPK